MFYTGTNWEESLQYFTRALPTLQQDKGSVAHLRLLCDMGLSYFRVNNLQESQK
jgi:hypothetical protein